MTLSILDEKRKKLIKDLSFVKDEGFYLAGGTALALQIDHRFSYDFDFYNRKKFDSQDLLQELETNFDDIDLIQTSEQTIMTNVRDIEVSFFHYPYQLVNSLVRSEDIPPLASIQDIAAMKVIAIIQRGTRRDFIDIYFLIKEMELKEIIETCQEKYPSFNPHVALKSLTYFEDAEQRERKIKLQKEKKLAWDQVKNYLQEQVEKYKQDYLKET